MGRGGGLRGGVRRVGGVGVELPAGPAGVVPDLGGAARGGGGHGRMFAPVGVAAQRAAVRL